MQIRWQIKILRIDNGEITLAELAVLPYMVKVGQILFHWQDLSKQTWMPPGRRRDKGGRPLDFGDNAAFSSTNFCGHIHRCRADQALGIPVYWIEELRSGG